MDLQTGKESTIEEPSSINIVSHRKRCFRLAATGPCPCRPKSDFLSMILDSLGWNELALLMGTFRDRDAEQEEPDVLMAYGEK